MNTSDIPPKVVISVMVQKEGKILLNLRKGSFASEQYGTPGGKLEGMETFQECAERECAEEAGITIGKIRFMAVMNNLIHNPHHFVSVIVAADWVGGEPQVLEPEKCAGWDWYEMDHLPSPLTEVTRCLIEAVKTGQNYFDAKAV